MSEKEIIDKIFARFEEFINSNDLMLVNIEELKVVWAVRDPDGKTLKGFLRIGKKHIPFYASFKKTELTLWIPSIGHIFYPDKVVKNFLEEDEKK
ncbi:hypothetical protein SULI_08035 [Saccharolobus solfataricus]|uniref:Uncharacterized protein n=2 Tax=Saccharolobus solfataricus TaxID=2287 RepID=A0A0E3MDM3_SACSO|nr:hypothetical protein [Saccharolobus solfataricus]AKA73865.1 hypothetical protein SULB_1607 [Saccharolobus solfataricus]AKA76563.1 hypothetical protein SULC_1605 [Saccharolobus solfataricus]AKA79256.1 hypothetical protein SULA_1606 [Saccharolobus solfataricus]AZF68345.1 hypothetical protein SULG_08035 [Saccharolobus solfataricus]AZF70965.1 hypothetical protein SULH_08035 [Saccharolobus solfataricus]